MCLTIIITASFSPIHPNIIYIKKVIKSLNYLEIYSNNKINVLLSHDALNPMDHFKNKEIYKSNLLKYQEYLKNLEKYIEEYNKESTKFILRIIKNNTWGHLTGNIRNCIEYVETEFIFMLQHDLSFFRKINISSIIEDMKENSQLKHIQFHRENILDGWFKDKINFLNNHNIITKKNEYISTLSWMDQNHLTTKKYYLDLVLKLCKNGCFMEACLHKKNNSLNTHKIFGTYVYGKYLETKYTEHIQGKNSLMWNKKYKIL